MIYPIFNMAKDLGKNQSTIKKATRELKDAGLMEKNGRDSVCRIFFTLKFHRKDRKSVCPKGKKRNYPERQEPVAQREN